MQLASVVSLSDREAARRLSVAQPTVSLWRRRFRAGRLNGLHDELKPGRPRSHDEERLAQLLHTALKQKPAANTHLSRARSCANHNTFSSTVNLIAEAANRQSRSSDSRNWVKKLQLPADRVAALELRLVTALEELHAAVLA